jgi:predicted nucleic acid-binding protein
MDAYYFDTSALVKWYVAEAGTAWVTSILSPAIGNDVYTVQVTGAEVIAAFSIRVRTGTLSSVAAQIAIAQFKSDFRNELQLVDVTDDLIDTAMTLAERHGLRGYDAVHLASALVVQAHRRATRQTPITFVSADGRLNAAAAAEGLAVEDPTTHA